MSFIEDQQHFVPQQTLKEQFGVVTNEELLSTLENNKLPMGDWGHLTRYTPQAVRTDLVDYRRNIHRSFSLQREADTMHVFEATMFDSPSFIAAQRESVAQEDISAYLTYLRISPN